MVPLSASVIVVSRNRPTFLRRCLLAVGQLDYARFECVVVACPAGARVAREMGVSQVVETDRANISAARNLGVSRACGEIAAFLDDDAVPEPTWLWHLVGAFGDTSVAQAGGTTLGRNGISVQQAASHVNCLGQSVGVVLSGLEPMLVPSGGEWTPRLHGTNMAIRHERIREIGGFDERFAFYLDETDLSYRIAQSGGGTAFVPKAVVHHASGPSVFRNAKRTPLSVFEIAASAGVFHRKHCPGNRNEAARTAFLCDRRNWLLRYMRSGALAPDVAHKLIRELDAGYEDGLARQSIPVSIPQIQTVMSESEPRTPRDLYLIAPTVRSRATRNAARERVARGDRVTVFDYRPGMQFHRVHFTNEGYWLHTGGIHGRERRDEPLFSASTREARIARTLDRLAGIRSKNVLLSAN